MRTSTAAILAFALAACGQSPGKPDAATAEGTSPATATVAAVVSADPCSLVPDPSTTFSQPVTASKQGMPDRTMVCQWKNSAGMLCGSVTPFGGKWNAVANVDANFRAMTTSMAAFGEVKDQPGIGEEARIVNGGILGVQIALRTKDAAALVASACSSATMDATAQAQKLASDIAANL